MSDYEYNPEECTEVIELDMTDEEFLLIAKAAHKLDITVNHFINLALHKEMERIQNMSDQEKLEYTTQAKQALELDDVPPLVSPELEEKIL